MDKRLLYFFMVSMAIIFAFQLAFPPPKKALPSSAATQPDSSPQSPTREAEEIQRPSESAPSQRIEASSVPAGQAPEANDPPAQDIEVRTNLWEIVFSTRGAVPISWRVIDPKYLLPATTESTTSGALELIPNIPGAVDREYPFELSLREANGGGYLEAFNRRVYSVERQTAQDGAQTIIFLSPVINGLVLRKAFVIRPSRYDFKLQVSLYNKGDQNLRFDDGGMGPGIGWGGGLGPLDETGGSSRAYSAKHAAVWFRDGSPEFDFEDEEKPGEPPRSVSISPQWAGMTDRYFLSALVPAQKEGGIRAGSKIRNAPPGKLHTNSGEIRKGAARQSMEICADPFLLPPGGSNERVFNVYVGPKSKETLNQYEKILDAQLDESLFYNSWRWFRGLCLFFMQLLNWLNGYLHNYGLSIIGLTLIIRLVTQPFVQMSMKSTARFAKVQQKLKPELDEIVKKYKNDPQKRNEETWKLYAKHKANPLGMMKGCFWMFIQMPVFMAFYRILDASIDLRGATFLWIDDLSRADCLFHLPPWVPYFTCFNVLPIVMTLTQYLSMKLTMTTATDPTQRQMAYMMPVMFLFIMYNMSSGLVLYWTISNAWQIGSQHFINKAVSREGAAGPAAPSPPPTPGRPRKP